MKTNQKINSVIAKALAQKIYNELRQKADKKDEENLAERIKIIKSDPRYKKWQQLYKEYSDLEQEMEKQYK